MCPVPLTCGLEDTLFLFALVDISTLGITYNFVNYIVLPNVLVLIIACHLPNSKVTSAAKYVDYLKKKKRCYIS